MSEAPAEMRAAVSRLLDLAKRLAASTPLAALSLVIVVAVLYLRARGLVAPDAASASDRLWVFRDFRDSIYYPAVAFLDGVNPYDPQAYRAAYPVNTFPLYSPLTLLLYAPLASLSYPVARWTYFAVTIALYGVMAGALLRFAGRETRPAPLLWLWLLILASRPGHQNLLNGQSTAQVVLGVLLALQYVRTRPLLAGLGIALASLKPTFGVPLAVLLLCQGHARTVLRSGAAIALALAGVLAVIAYQQGGVEPVLDAIRSNLGAHGEHRNTNLLTSYSRIDLAMFVGRWSGWIPDTRMELIAGAALLVGVGAALRWYNRGRLEDGMCCWSSVLITFAVPLCIYHQSYDALMLAISAVALGMSPLAAGSGPRGWAAAVALCCALVPLGNYLVTDGVLKRLALEPGIWRYLTVMNSTIIVIGLAACLAAMRSGPEIRERS